MSSGITIRSKDSNANLTIQPEDLDKVLGDVNIIAKPTGGHCLTKNRLNYIVNESKNIDPNKLCNVPKVISYKVTRENYKDNYDTLSVELSSYYSNIAYPYGGTVIIVEVLDGKATNNVITTIHNIAYSESDSGKVSIRLDGDTQTPGYVLRFKVGYLTGSTTVLTNWVTFKLDRPTKDAIQLEPLGSDAITYQNRPPYGFSMMVRLNTTTSNHVATTWRIYSKVNDEYEQVWIMNRSDTSLNEVRIANLVPQYLSYGNTYYVTAQCHYQDGTYTVESDYLPFTLDGIRLNPPPCVGVYPGKVSISNPTLGCSDEIDLHVQNRVVNLDRTSMESYTWKIIGPKGTRTYVTYSSSVKLGYGELEPNTSYELIVTYKHKNVGVSPETRKVFKTEPKFVIDPSGIDDPIRIYNGMAYYGEVVNKDLMSDTINYRGVYVDNEIYNPGDEVSKDGLLYICVRKKHGATSNFRGTFELASKQTVNPLYKSGLPSYRWILKELGFNPFLTSPGIPTDDRFTNFLHQDTGGWIKCQNVLGKVIYISKFNTYNGLSFNDLVKTGIFHPNRRTIRIRDKLYYARVLCSTIEAYYDMIDPIKKDKLNTIYGSSIVKPDEDTLMTYLLSGKLNNYVSTDLDASTIDYKEIVYTHNKLTAAKIVTSNSVAYGTLEISKPDLREFTVRLVLEEIPEDERPIYNLSDALPGANGKRDEEGNLVNYDPYGEFCYLDFVTVEQFLSSFSINEKTGLFMDICTPNLGWHKIYSRGLVYYVSQGQNYVNADVKRLEDMNMLSPTPLYKENNGVYKPKDIKYCKVMVNGLIFNVTVPDIVNYDNLHRMVRDEYNNEYDIITGKYNNEFSIGDKSFWSNSMYRVIKERVDSPVVNKVGFKGYYPSVPKDEQNVDYIVDGKQNGWFITSKRMINPDGSNSYLLNSEEDTYVMKEHTAGDKVDVVLVLTVVPTVGNKKIWGVK